MNATRKVNLKDITSNLTCKLCLGYLVDATTIIECLHSFCKSCIIKYLDKSADLEEKYCPVCDVQLHSTKPLTSIRPDLMLQEIVYKLVPGLFKNEMARRRELYQKNQNLKPSTQLDSGQVFDELYITSDDIIHLSLEYVTDDVTLQESTTRYLKCPAAVGVFILKKFIQGKYDLPQGTNIDIMFGDRILPDDFLLMDIAYKYSWTMNGSKPLALRYRIRDIAKQPEIISDKTINDSASSIDRCTIPSQDEAVTPTANRKVCNENGNNIMPSEGKPATPIKVNGNGLISGQKDTVKSIKSLSGKIKGRKRKHLKYSEIVIESQDDVKNLAKRLKLPKQEKSAKSQTNGMVQSSTQVDAVEIGIKEKEKSESNEDGKEVQLQISENGVMSARSGKDNIILNTTFSPSATSLSSNISNPSPTASQNRSLTDLILLSGGIQHKTRPGPSGVTEIICDKPDQIVASQKPSNPKPGYVTLNIPNPTSDFAPPSSFRQRTLLPDLDKLRKDSNSKQNGTTPSTDIPSRRSPQMKKSTVNQSTIESIKNRIAAKGKDGENVIKAIADLGKLCNGVNGVTVTPSSSTEMGSQSETQNTTSGIHSLPITALCNKGLKRPKPPNGLVENRGDSNGFSLPLSLNFSAASGMSVSMIPCTTTTTATSTSSNMSSTTCATVSTTTPRKLSHQTTVVNGDMRFTTSPKNTPLSTAENDISPKKAPKFFKSRLGTSSPVNISKQKQPSPVPKVGMDTKRKTPVPNGLEEPLQKKARENPRENGQTITNAYKSILPQIGLPAASTSTVPSHHTSKDNMSVTSAKHMSSVADKFSHHLSALSTLAANPSSNDYNHLGMAASVAAAAAAAVGNAPVLPFGMGAFPAESFNRISYLSLGMPYGYGFTNYGPSVISSGMQLNPTKITPAPSKSNSSPENYSKKSSSCGSPAPESASLDLTVSKPENAAPATSESKSGKSGEGSQFSLLADLLKLKKMESKKEESSTFSRDRDELTDFLLPSSTKKKETEKVSGDSSQNSGKEACRKEKSPNRDRKTSNSTENRESSPNKDMPTTEKAQSNLNGEKQTSPIMTTNLPCAPTQNNNDSTVSNNYEKLDKTSSDNSTPPKTKVSNNLDCANASIAGSPEIKPA